MYSIHMLGAAGDIKGNSRWKIHPQNDIGLSRHQGQQTHSTFDAKHWILFQSWGKWCGIIVYLIIPPLGIVIVCCWSYYSIEFLKSLPSNLRDFFDVLGMNFLVKSAASSSYLMKNGSTKCLLKTLKANKLLL